MSTFECCKPMSVHGEASISSVHLRAASQCQYMERHMQDAEASKCMQKNTLHIMCYGKEKMQEICVGMVKLKPQMTVSQCIGSLKK